MHFSSACSINTIRGVTLCTVPKFLECSDTLSCMQHHVSATQLCTSRFLRQRLTIIRESWMDRWDSSINCSRSPNEQENVANHKKYNTAAHEGGEGQDSCMFTHLFKTARFGGSVKETRSQHFTVTAHPGRTGDTYYATYTSRPARRMT